MKPMLYPLLAVLILALPGAAAGQCRLDYSNFHIVFEENFDSVYTAAALSPRWVFQPADPGWAWGNAGSAVPGATLLQQLDSSEYYSPAAVSVFHEGGNGFLRLTAERYPTPATVHSTTPVPGSPSGFDRRAVFRSGMIRSRPDLLAPPFQGCVNSVTGEPWGGFIHGMFEIRMKIPRGITFPAFWLAGPSQLNVFEGKFGEREYGVGFSRFWDEDNGRYNWRRKVSGDDLAADFHIYTAVWTPDKISFFLDGRETATFTGKDVRELAGFPLWCEANAILVTLQMPKWSDVQRCDLDVDYIRVYKPEGGDYGLPFKSARAFIHSTRLEQSPRPLPPDPGFTVRPGSGTIAVDPARPGEVFFINSNGGLTLKRSSAEGRPAAYAVLRSQSDTAATASGDIRFVPSLDAVLFAGTDGSICAFRRDSAQVMGWRQDRLPATTRVAGGPGTIGTSSAGDIFFKGTDDRMHHLFPENGAWQQHDFRHPFTLSAEVDGDIVADDSGNIVFYRGKDGLLQCFTHGSDDRYTHAYVDTTEAASAYPVRDRSGAIAFAPGIESVLYAGPDGHVHAYTRRESRWMHSLLSDTVSAAGPLVWSDGGKMLCFTGMDGRLQALAPDSSLPGGWRHVRIDDYDGIRDYAIAPENIPTTAVWAGTDKPFPRVYYRSSDGGLAWFQYRPCEFPDQPDGSWNTTTGRADPVK